MKSESEVTQLCPTRNNPMTSAYQAPPSMGFSRQEYWSGVPLPSPLEALVNQKADVSRPEYEVISVWYEADGLDLDVRQT